ncbi:MAG: hypothetical protein ACE5GN_06590, partial [Waddliaceae bacterium]
YNLPSKIIREKIGQKSPQIIISWAHLMRLYLSVFFILFFLTSCGRHFKTPSYAQQYVHLNQHFYAGQKVSSSDYYLILAVDARHLDYSNGKELLRTMVKHPSDGSKNSDVGHAWILLHGVVDGKCG